MTKLKLCINCHHYKPSGSIFYESYCAALAKNSIDLVTGVSEISGLQQVYVIRYAGECGEEGKLFKAKI